MQRLKKIKRSGTVFAVAFLLVSSSLLALEEKSTLKEAVDSSKHVALVEVADVIQPGSNIETIEVEVLETYKGNLPNRIQLKVLTASRVLNPTGLSVQEGMRWVVLLGNPKADGIYPFASLSYGKINLAYNENNDTYYLIKRVTGYGKEYEKSSISIDVFAGLVGR